MTLYKQWQELSNEIDERRGQKKFDAHHFGH